MSPQKTRTRVACKSCNLRRVKCDRTADSACSNCRLVGANCEMINSRRGKYPRVSNRRPVVFQDEFARLASDHDSSPVAGPESPSLSMHGNTSELPERSTTENRQNRRCVSPSLSEIAVQKKNTNDPGKVVYMGDSANLKYVLHEVGDPFKSAKKPPFWGDNLQRSMLEKLGRPTQSAIQSLHTEEEKYLRNNGVFQLPSKEISDELVNNFQKYSLPAFPIFLWEEFMAKYNSGSISPLILNAVYMVATFHCPESVLRNAAFPSRYLAGLTFYRRAKALYDANCETDGIIIVQSTLLLSNWWGGPMEQKDTWYWLGVTSGLAQSLGMHRSKSYHILPQASQKVWRRIWWVLYINDIHHAAVYGRPPHIHPAFCDISPIKDDDFDSYSTAFQIPESQQSKGYFVHLADLLSRVGDCLVNKLSSGCDPDKSRISYEKLLQWRETLPPSFRDVPSQITMENGFWPALIHLYFCDYQIVFYRMLFDNPITVGLNSPLFQAAGRISRTLEDLIASGTLFNAPFLILPSIFASILVHIINIRKGDPHVRLVSEHRARLAMHVLDKFQDIWALSIWTRHLLDALLKTSKYQSSNDTDYTGPPMPLHPQAFYQGHGQRTADFQNVQYTVPDITNHDIATSLSPPRSTSDGYCQSHECWDGNHLDGIPVPFPFTNLLEDTGFSLETCFGPWNTSILDQ